MLSRTLLGFVALFASLVLVVAGNSALGTVAALRLEIEGFEPGTIGVVLAFTALGFVTGSLFGIRAVQRVGHVRAFAVFGAVAAAAALAHALHVSAPAWMVFRFALGFSIAGLMLVTESWVNARATPQTRGALLATYMVLFFLAASGGQFVVALGDPALHHLFIVAAMSLVLALVPVSLTRTPAPEASDAGRLSVAVLWRRAELGLAGAAVSGLLLGAFGTVGPVYGYEVGLEVDEIATFMGLSILAAMLVQWPMGYLSDYIPRRVAIVAVAAAALAAALFVAAFAQRSTAHLYGGVAAFYALASCVYPLCLALTHDMLDKAQIVPASATLLLANGVGAVAGPIVGGLAIDALGPRGLFLALAGGLGALLALAVHSFLRERAPRVAEQSHCVGIAPVSTTAILELDPRQGPDAPSARPVKQAD
jgi:MFS family permease